MPNLKHIIYFLNVPSNGYSLIQTSERYRAVGYKYFFGIPYQDNSFIKPSFENKINKRCMEIAKRDIPNNDWGFVEDRTYTTSVLASTRVVSHLRENTREPDQIEWLSVLCKDVKRNNQNLLLIIPPFRNDYKEKLPNGDKLFEKVKKAKLYSAKIVDFYNSTVFNDTDFGDTDHLNSAGAKKMTLAIKKIIDEGGN